MSYFFAPGFFSSAPEHLGLAIGGFVAVVTALVGVFVVMRQQTFAGHALTDVATAGGSASFLLGWPVLSGFIIGGTLGGGAIDALATKRDTNSDVATGIVLGAASGASALFLFLAANGSTSTGGAQHILFGSLNTIPHSLVVPILATGVVAVVTIGAICRPLLLASLSFDLAMARGVRVRVVNVAFMGAVAVSVGLASIVLGSILATALLIGPAAAASRVTRRLSSTLALSSVFGVSATWVGTLLSYDSYTWTASHRPLPVSFFVVVLVVTLYVGAVLSRRNPSARQFAGRREQGA